MRVLICGGRDFTDYERLRRVLDKSLYIDGITTVIHGGAQGADACADVWAKQSYIPVKCYPAQWDKYGRSAGPVRNQQMLDEGKPDLVIAFPGGAGTANMIKIARRAGIDVLVVAA
jgi:hypothetical protein